MLEGHIMRQIHQFLRAIAQHELVLIWTNNPLTNEIKVIIAEQYR